MKKIITTFGMTIIVLVALSIEVFAFYESGICGTALKWSLNNAGTLVISGTGDMDKYSIASPAPWYEFRDEVEVEQAVIRDNVTSIGDYAFYECTKLQSIDIPINIATIGQCAFYGCSNLQISVNADNPYFSSINGVLCNKEETTLCAYAKNYSAYTIPDGTTTIAPYAFAGNAVLTAITLPNTITEIGENAFEGCTGLNKIVFNGAAAEWNSINIDASNTTWEEKVVFPDRVYISGDSLLEIGTTSTKQAVTYSSPTELEYFLCTIKYPSCFKLIGYTPVDFEYVSKDTEKDDGEYTTTTFTCQYSGSSIAPSDITVTPFEMTFGIAEDISLDTYAFTLEDGTEGIDGNGNTVSFGALEAKNIALVPKQVENIEIVGSDTVYDEAEYTALVSPENAVNKTVEWSVSNANIAEISEQGVLTAKKNGTVTLIAKATDGSKVYSNKEVTVYAYASMDNLVSDIGEWSKEFTPADRRYTIYVDENAASITLTPAFTGGTLLCDGAVWINGRDKEFVLENTKTTIQLERKNVDGYEDGVYTITVIKGVDNPAEEITAIGDYYGKVTVTKTEYDNKITLTVTPLSDIDLSGLRMYVAEYNEGVLRDIRLGSNSIYDGKLTVTSVIPVSLDYKIMLWNGLNPVIETIGYGILKGTSI